MEASCGLEVCRATDAASGGELRLWHTFLGRLVTVDQGLLVDMTLLFCNVTHERLVFLDFWVVQRLLCLLYEINSDE